VTSQSIPRPVRPELETRMRRAAYCGGALILACAVLGGVGAVAIVNHYTREIA
jgi:hypothetical protein